jgi:hypothetical protein
MGVAFSPAHRLDIGLTMVLYHVISDEILLKTSPTILDQQ